MTTTHLSLGLVCALTFTFGHGCPWQGPWWDDDDQGEDDGEDDGEPDPDPEPEACSWALEDAAFPIEVWSGQAVFGEIAFDGNCDLIVGGGEELPYVEALYRVSQVDGTVTSLVTPAQLPFDTLVISGITYRASDQRIYFTVGVADAPDMLYAIDDQDVVHAVLELGAPIQSLAVAPAGFGAFGDQLIGVQFSPSQLVAIDAGNTNAITTFASLPTGLGVAEFGPDGTLYVTDSGANQIATVTADGVFEPFYAEGLGDPVGLAIDPDGSRMFVTHMTNWIGSIDEISIPDAALTHHTTFDVVGSPVGMLVDGDRLLFGRWLDDYSVVDVLATP